MPNNEDPTVGYRKPPAHSRWKKGQSGNPAGRPKKLRKKVADYIEDLLAEEIALTENGETRRSTIFEAILLQLLRQTLQGKVRAMDSFYKYQKFAANKPIFEVGAAMSIEEARIQYLRLMCCAPASPGKRSIAKIRRYARRPVFQSRSATEASEEYRRMVTGKSDE